MAKKYALKKSKAGLELIVGPMFSGKTDELLRRITKYEYGDVEYLIFKPKLDTRDGEYVKSRTGACKKCILVDSPEDIYKTILEEENKGRAIDVIAVDEAQLFLDDMVNRFIEVVEELTLRNYRVLVAGLEKDFKGEPFGAIPELMCRCDTVTKLTAVCKICGADASCSQRLIDDKPARYKDPIVLIGNSESYEPRCRFCHKVPGKPKTIMSKKFQLMKEESFKDVKELIETLDEKEIEEIFEEIEKEKELEKENHKDKK